MGVERLRVVGRSEQLSLCDMFDDRDFAGVKAELDILESSVYYGQGETVKFRVEYGYDYTDVYMDVYRDETDKEYAARQTKEEKAREKSRKARETKKEKARKVLMATEAAERAEFERLKAKFET